MDPTNCKPSNNNGVKVLLGFGGLGSIAAIGTAIFSYIGGQIQPLHQRIDSTAQQVDQRAAFIERQQESHESLVGHSGAIGDLARLTEKFTEIETQFRGVREVLALRFEHVKAMAALEVVLSRLDERLKNLEDRQP